MFWFPHASVSAFALLYLPDKSSVLNAVRDLVLFQRLARATQSLLEGSQSINYTVVPICDALNPTNERLLC